ncbi:MAG: hypothetical protein U0934_16790 [Pseudotabrizicola sp.]|uniref:hypothetical protein n=1 Tax=Pseudotabrizicola sp. TaxID=2939647 RepID=UPI002ACEB3B3|nr:hypothetical protein [Pseudotabrizicola sp.]MDZ7575588.1 hypothetical protein [Pseudotabrizicola sp.]
MCHLAGFLLHFMLVKTDYGPPETALLTSAVIIGLDPHLISAGWHFFGMKLQVSGRAYFCGAFSR